MPDGMARREFMKAAAPGAVASSASPVICCASLPARNQQGAATLNAKETLDVLLKTNRDHERIGGPRRNNHVPMTLIALYRTGATSEQMHRYVENFKLTPSPPPDETPKTAVITPENWRNELGRGRFTDFVEFFEGRTKRDSVESALKESVPALMKGSSAAAFHPLLRLGYAIDYGNREEIVYSLAFWAAAYYPSPDFDARGKAADVDAFFSDVVKGAASLRINTVGSIDGRIHQVFATKGFSTLMKPIRFPDSNPLEKVSELIMEAFTESQHFTLLHALTSCQALRLLLPYMGDRQTCLSQYWHAACAAYLTVSTSKFEMRKDSVTGGGAGWDEVLPKAAAREGATVSQMEHVLKLAYSCWVESKHYKRDRYLALAAREISRPSPFV